jgi:hypothetical protein
LVALGAAACGSKKEASGSSGSAAAPPAFKLDCFALVKVAELASTDTGLETVRGAERSRRALPKPPPPYVGPTQEILYDATVQVAPGQPAKIKKEDVPASQTDENSPRADVLSYHVELHREKRSKLPSPTLVAGFKELGAQVRACLPSFKVDESEATDYMIMHSPDERTVIFAAYDSTEDDPAFSMLRLSVQPDRSTPEERARRANERAEEAAAPAGSADHDDHHSH